MLEKTDSKIVITPHMKEMCRLLQCDMKELQNDRAALLQQFVNKYPVTCVLKDARTLVAKKAEKLYVNMTGNSAMAKGGSGDVLAGIIAGLLAQQKDSFKMATLGVFLHGLSGDLSRDQKGKYSVLANDLIYSLVDILRQI